MLSCRLTTAPEQTPRRLHFHTVANSALWLVRENPMVFALRASANFFSPKKTVSAQA
jgi:hypothetical protein